MKYILQKNTCDMIIDTEVVKKMIKVCDCAKNNYLLFFKCADNGYKVYIKFCFNVCMCFRKTYFWKEFLNRLFYSPPM